jgi:uroporphyrinogen-III synthase
VRVLITRPRERALELAREVERRGDTALIEPLLTIEPVVGAAPDLDGVQAIVLTSAHAVPALSTRAKRLPVFAVGDATAAAARAAGCDAVLSARGTATDLARLIAAHCHPGGGALFHLGGEQVREELADELTAAGFVLYRQAVYRAVAARALAPATVEALEMRQIDAALLFSPRTARIFVELIGEHALRHSLTGVSAICLSAAVAEPCRELVWHALHVAARPELGVLLEALEAARRRW